jgi:hypothetical protein
LEVFRGFIVIGLGIVWIPGVVFPGPAGRLIAFGPFLAPGSPGPTAGVLLARCFFVALGLIILALVVHHHFWVGPRELWLSGGDRGYFRPDHPPSPLYRQAVPSPGDPDYATYLHSCALPYWLYFVYSAINFVIVLNTMFTLSMYAVILDLQTRIRTWDTILNDLRSLRRTKNTVYGRFGELRDSIQSVLERYYGLLLFIVFAVTFELWFDQYNLTPTGAAETWNATLFLLLPLATIFFTVVLFYGWAVGWTAQQLASPLDRTDFLARNDLPRFLGSSLYRSRYFWPLVACAVAGYPIWRLLKYLGLL